MVKIGFMSGRRKWLLLVLIVLITAPTTVVATSYTTSTVLGNISARALPPVDSVPARVYSPGEGFSGHLPITHTKVEITTYFGSGPISSIFLKLQTPNGEVHWISLASYQQLIYEYWPVRGDHEPYNNPMHVIRTPLLLQYEKQRPVTIGIGYEVLEQVYSILKSRSVINCSMEQLRITAFWTPDKRDSAKVWIDGSSPIVIISTTRFYSWLSYRVVEARLDDVPVPTDGRSVVLPAGATGSHALTVVLKGWMPIPMAKTTFQISL
jgi:hypothetical protein